MNQILAFFTSLTVGKKFLLFLTPFISILLGMKALLFGLAILITIDLVTGIIKSFKKKKINYLVIPVMIFYVQAMVLTNLLEGRAMTFLRLML